MGATPHSEKPDSPIPPSGDSGPAPFDTSNPPLNTPTPGNPEPAASPRVQLTEGARPLPDFELMSVLGEGGFGQVWKALGPGGFKVALKFVRLEERAGDVEMRSLELMKDIQHAHLLPIFGAWQRDRYLIVAMELAGGTLLDRLRQALGKGLPGIPRDELLEYMREAAKGIDYLNERRHLQLDGSVAGIQHKDIKPQNLLLVGSSVKVADFGLAKILQHSVTAASSGLTPAYAPPEFYKGKATSWSDQYSLAVSYCQLRGGRLPFAGNLYEILEKHRSEPPDLTMLPTAAEQAAVARALAKEPSARWPTCRAFVEALTSAAVAPDSGRRKQPITAPPPVAETRTKKPKQPVRRAPDVWETTPTTDSIPTEKRPPSTPPRRWLVPALAGACLLLALVVIVVLLRDPGDRKGANGGGSVPTNKIASNTADTPPATGKIPAPPSTEVAAKQTKKEPVSDKPAPPPEVAAKQPKKEPVSDKPAPPPEVAAKQIKKEPVPEKPTPPSNEVASKNRKKEPPSEEFVPPPPPRLREKPPLAVAPFDADKAKEHQRAWAKYLGQPVEEDVDLGGDVKLKLVLVPPGTFMMGAPKGESDQTDETPHEVTITQAFYLGKYEVTVGQFRQFIRANNNYQTDAEKDGKGGYGFDVKTGKYEQKPKYTWENPGFAQTDDHPVVNVSWQDAQAFCTWLNSKGKHKYGLPSEAQWEYSCRAGTTTRFSSGQEEESLKDVANVADAALKRAYPAATDVGSWDDGYPFTAPVGKKDPNAWGLKDMHGNAWEWCNDCYDEKYYQTSPKQDPPGPKVSAGASRVIRGGAWSLLPWDCRAAFRDRHAPSDRSSVLGFRLLRLR